MSKTQLPKRRRLRIAMLIAAGLLAAAIAGLIWLKSLFNDSAAKQVPSLAAEFQARSILGVFAHPDDELVAAGFLADAARRDGVAVRTITATRGESGHPDPPICRQADLGIIRQAESLRYGFFLGLDGQEIWDFPDGALDAVPPEKLVREIVSRIRKWKPDVLLTFDPGSGFTLHADHLAIGRAAGAAFRRAADPAYEPDLGAPFAPRILLHPLAPAGALRHFGGDKGRAIAEKQRPPQYAISIEPETKIRGWEIEKSQQSYLRKAWHMPPWILYRLYDREFFAVAAER